MTTRGAASPSTPPRSPDDRIPSAPSSGPAATGTPSTRERIALEALRLFSERGTAAVSVREVADAAGVTVPGLYYHFASKADLIREVFRAHALRPGWQPESGFPPLSSHTVVERIIEQARREFTHMQSTEEFLRHMLREDTLGDPDARAARAEVGSAWRARWSEVLAGSDDIAPDADVELAAEVIGTFLWGLFLTYLSRRDPAVPDHIESFARLIGGALTAAR